MAGAASWSFNENDFKQIQTHLQAFLRDSNARCALLVDRNASWSHRGETPQFDPTRSRHSRPPISVPTINSPKMIGRSGVRVARASGEKESMYLADIAKRVDSRGAVRSARHAGTRQAQGKIGRG